VSTPLRLAMYKGPPSDALHWVGHAAVCLRTMSRYSHIELVFGESDAQGFAECWSSSSRDGGVRGKRIDLMSSGHWDVFELPQFDELDAGAALIWFQAHEGDAYDWWGNAGFVLPWRTEDRSKLFCSEAVMQALAEERPWTDHPRGALDRLVPDWRLQLQAEGLFE
jgi:hypothetical protein